MGVYGLRVQGWRGDGVIYTGNQKVLAEWLCERIGMPPTKYLRCIGRLSADGRRILAVVGYDEWNGASCQVHVAGEGNWVNRSLLYVAFHYPFVVCKCEMVLALVSSGNKKALRLGKHLGFKTEHEIVGAHPDGSLVIMSMRRAECRWLDERTYGQKIIPTPAAA